MSRKYVVCGRMHNMTESIDELINFFNKAPLDDKTELLISPPADHLEYAVNRLTRMNVTVAADHSTAGPRQAFSAHKVKDSGAQWVILGHWDRRQTIGETHQEIGEQAKQALKAGLKVMVCVGENLKQRELLQTQQILGSQMEAIAANVEEWGRVVVVYQPGWTVNTSKQTTPREVQRVHSDLRHWLASRVSTHTAESTRIIFGGFVTGNNVADMAYRESIDGFLVSDAAPSYDFLKIVNARK